MAQGEFFVERQNWARWPRVLKVNRVTDSGTETRRYVRKGADWEAKDYATRKIVELQTENAKLRELVRDYEHCTMYADCAHCKYDGKLSTHCPLSPCFPDTDELRELGVEVNE